MSRGSNRQAKADDVYARTKRAIDELAQLAFGLCEQRSPKEEDQRDKDAFDALEDVRQISAELSTLWDTLWESIGGGRTDPIAWSNRAFESFDPDEDDGWLQRYVAEKGRKAFARVQRPREPRRMVTPAEPHAPADEASATEGAA